VAFALHPVGHVESSLTDRSAAPMQGNEGAPDADVVIRPEFAGALDGVEPGAELIVLTWFHESPRDVLKVLPRDDPANPLTGVFATRSPDRPNPIGLHRVTLLARDGLRLTVSELEAIDGTPVVDIKPVLRRADF
jgi:tRNA-Thr(GGU) m(6)t(6)A37 methyltransferase TsaA